MSTATSVPPQQPPDTPSPSSYIAVEQTPEFSALRRAYRRFVFPVTVAFLVWYGLYVVLSAYARGFMSTKIGGSNINVALIFGLLQFASTFAIAWLYVWYADRKLDSLAQRLRVSVENHPANGGGPR